jgi:hypothetical protein
VFFDIVSDTLIVSFISFDVFDSECFDSVVAALFAAKSQMHTIGRWSTDDTSIAGGVTTVFDMVSKLTTINTSTNGSMSLLISYESTYSTIKGVEISKPVTIIVGVCILHNTAIDTKEVL